MYTLEYCLVARLLLITNTTPEAQCHTCTPQIREFIPGSGTTRCISPRKPNAVVGAPPGTSMLPRRSSPPG